MQCYILGGGGTGLNAGGGGTPGPDDGGLGGGGRFEGGAGGRDGTMAGGGAGPVLPPRGSISLKLNWRKNSLVSLFQWVQNLVSDLSTSLEGTLKAMVS